MSMIKRLLALDGVNVVCHFRDDGYLLEGYGLMSHDNMARLAGFAHDYRRMIQGNADQVAMFTGMRGWTPPRGWIVRGANRSVCGVGNLVCIVDSIGAPLNEILLELHEVSHW
jgi:roadblock/LC7 domain-containing protein